MLPVRAAARWRSRARSSTLIWRCPPTAGGRSIRIRRRRCHPSCCSLTACGASTPGSGYTAAMATAPATEATATVCSRRRASRPHSPRAWCAATAWLASPRSPSNGACSPRPPRRLTSPPRTPATSPGGQTAAPPTSCRSRCSGGSQKPKSRSLCCFALSATVATICSSSMAPAAAAPMSTAPAATSRPTTSPTSPPRRPPWSQPSPRASAVPYSPWALRGGATRGTCGCPPPPALRASSGLSAPQDPPACPAPPASPPPPTSPPPPASPPPQASSLPPAYQAPRVPPGLGWSGWNAPPTFRPRRPSGSRIRPHGCYRSSPAPRTRTRVPRKISFPSAGSNANCGAGSGTANCSTAPSAPPLSGDHLRAAASGTCGTLRPSPRPNGVWAGDKPGERVSHGLGHGRVVQPEPTGQARDLAGDVPGRHRRDDGGGGAQGVELALGITEPPAPAVDLRVHDQVGKRAGALGQHVGKCGGAFVAQEVGGILPRHRRRPLDTPRHAAEQVIGGDRGLAAGLIRVERHDDAGRLEVAQPAKGRDVLPGQGGAARRHPRESIGTRGRARDHVQRAFNEDRPGTVCEQAARLPQPEQHLPLRGQHGARTVEVFRHRRPGPVRRTANEGDDRAAAVTDGQHGTVAEGVDERAAPGPARQPRSLDHRVGVAVRPQMAG